MRKAWSIVTVVASLGGGFGARIWGESPSDSAGSLPTEVAVTFRGRSSSLNERSDSEAFARAFGILAFANFAGARERLDELLVAHKRLPEMRMYSDPLESERILEEIERILSLASETELVDFITSRKFDYRSYSIADIAYGALARHSPKRAADLWLVERGRTEDPAGLFPVLGEWVKQDPAAADAWVGAIPDENAKGRAREAFLCHLAGSNPQAVIARLDEIDPENGNGVAMVLGAMVAPASLPGLADRFLESRPGGGFVLTAFLDVWGEREPEAMLAWVLAQDSEAISADVLKGSLGAVAFADPARFLDTISTRLPSNPALLECAARSWWAWLGQDGGEVAAIQWLGENGGLVLGFERTFGFEVYMDSDSWDGEKTQRLLAALAELPDSPAKSSISERMLVGLSRKSPELILGYALERLPLGPQTDMMIAQALGNWASEAPETAVRWSLDHLENEGARLQALRWSIARWGEKDGQSAADFSMSLPERERNAALWELGSAWARKQPEETIGYLSSASDPAAVSSMSKAAFREFAENKGAAEYFDKALAMPPGRMQHDAVRGLFGGWALSEKDAAAAAIERVPAGSLRDASILGFNEYAAREDPRKAMELAGQISVPAAREKELIFRARGWLKQNRNEAQAAIRSHPSLTEAMKEEIFK